MKHFVPATLALLLALASGCSLLHHKDKKASQPELPPSAGIEAEFRSRWTNKRAHELLAAGAATTEDQAQQMAAAEFAKQYPYLTPANQGARH